MPPMQAAATWTRAFGSAEVIRITSRRGVESSGRPSRRGRWPSDGGLFERRDDGEQSCHAQEQPAVQLAAHFAVETGFLG